MVPSPALITGSSVLSANLASNAILNDLDPYIYRCMSRFDEQIRCQELLRRLKDFQPDFVVFDTFRRMHRQDENESGAIDCLFGEVLLRVRDELGSSVLLLDHLNKAKKRLSKG